jgi:hypothetical protein
MESDQLPYLEPWSRSNPVYLEFGSEGLSIQTDFKKTYNTALDDSTPATTTTATTTPTTATTTTVNSNFAETVLGQNAKISIKSF